MEVQSSKMTDTKKVYSGVAALSRIKNTRCALFPLKPCGSFEGACLFFFFHFFSIERGGLMLSPCCQQPSSQRSEMIKLSIY